MECHCIAYVLLCVVHCMDLPVHLAEEVAMFEDKKLQSVPWDLVPDNTTILNIARNDINNLTVLPSTLIKLTEINATSNNVEHFPDLYNVKDTLVCLDLSRNNIEKVEPSSLLHQLQKLMLLGLYKNPLMTFPEGVYWLPQLSDLRIGRTNINVIPNLCFSDPINRRDKTLRIGHIGNTYICDQWMIWTKLAQDQGIISKGPGASCSDPPSVAGKLLRKISISDLIMTSKQYVVCSNVDYYEEMRNNIV